MAKATKKTKTIYSKGWATRRANAAKLGLSVHRFKRQAMAGKEGRRAPHVAMRDHGIHGGIFGNVATAPGRGEIVGGADSKLADDIVALARKRGGKDLVQAKLAEIQGIARYEGLKGMEELNAQNQRDFMASVRDRVICGFIAEVDAQQHINEGLSPDLIFMMNTFTLTKVVDALNEAGYTRKGRKNPLASGAITVTV